MKFSMTGQEKDDHMGRFDCIDIIFNQLLFFVLRS